MDCNFIFVHGADAHRTYLSLLHPRLLSTLVLLDPVIAAPSPGHRNSGYSVARMSTCRRDLWPSREDAINSFKKSKFYASWDPRVLEKWFQYGLRRLPTLIYPDANEGDERVTLTTTKHQEVFTFVRPNFQGFRTGEFDQKNHPDMEPEAATGSAFVRAEGLEVFRRLPNVRPSVLYVFGSESDLSTPEMRKAKIDATGVGVGGSGGAKAGRVKEVVLKGVGHLVAMEAVEQCADAATEWIGTEYKRWNAEEEEFRSMWSKNSMLEKTTFDNEFRETMGSLSKSATTPAKAKL